MNVDLVDQPCCKELLTDAGPSHDPDLNAIANP
jgi:hypothetical protein